MEINRQNFVTCLVSLCLTAQQVWAEAEQAKEGKPQAEEADMTMFIGLGVGALVVGAVAFMALGGSKSSGQKVTLDDVDEPSESKKSEESSAKKKKKSKKSEASTSSANMEGPIDKDVLF